MSSGESHRARSFKGARGLKGVHELKSAYGLKGVRELKGGHGPKSASTLPGVHQIKGIHKSNPKVDIAISILQALLQHAMKSQIKKLQENLRRASAEMKENLQSGLHRSLQAGADTIGGTRRDREK